MVKSPHLLNLGNPRKVKYELSSILDKSALETIENEIARNAISLFSVGLGHYRFAMKQTAPNWRQKVSRLYYSAYSVSRAVRLFTSGEYSTDVGDHQRFDKLPDDFPSKARFANQLAVLREDRNTCDYDHKCHARDLVLGTRNAALLVKDFLEKAENYLKNKGLKV